MRQLTRTRTTVLAAAALAATGLGALAGCAKPTAGPSRVGAPAPAAVNAALLTPGTAQDSVRGLAAYNQILTSVYGTPDDRLRAEARSAHALQSGIATCMSSAGHRYTPAGSEGTSGGPVFPGDLTSLAPIGNTDLWLVTYHRNVAHAADRRANPGYTNLTNAAAKAAYGKALGSCVSATKTVDPFTPTGQGELGAGIEALFRGIEARPDVVRLLTQYGVCMHTHGVPVDTYDALYQRIDAEYPDATLGTAKLTRDPRWSKAVADEQTAAKADTYCRRDEQAYVMGLAAPALDTFAAEHAGQLRTADTQWAALRNEPTS